MIEREFRIEEEFEMNFSENDRNAKEKQRTEFDKNSYFIQKQIEINSQAETRLLNIMKLFLFHFGLLDIRNSSEMAKKVFL